MPTVRVFIEERDRKVGAMVKALAVEVVGYTSVTGATKLFLHAHGYYEFGFPSDSSAQAFAEAVRRYLPEQFARVA
jgi:hypothetical protein